ncbi:hypothetical protein [uncultured Aquimarina sp.]|nr:hypothetical protein [uncultured Aquimarina sp.]
MYKAIDKRTRIKISKNFIRCSEYGVKRIAKDLQDSTGGNWWL